MHISNAFQDIWLSFCFQMFFWPLFISQICCVRTRQSQQLVPNMHLNVFFLQNFIWQLAGDPAISSSGGPQGSQHDVSYHISTSTSVVSQSIVYEVILVIWSVLSTVATCSAAHRKTLFSHFIFLHRHLLFRLLNKNNISCLSEDSFKHQNKLLLL